MTILEQVAQSASRTQYGLCRPKSTQEYFALRLASKVGESNVASHYIQMLQHYTESQMLTAYRRAVARSSNGDLARRFHVELEAFFHRDGSNGNGVSNNPLIAIRIERRAIAVAIFDGDHLKYTQSRQLSSSRRRAVSSAVNFVSRIIDKFSGEKSTLDSAALESIQNGNEIQRALLHREATQTLQNLSISVMEVSRSELFEAFGYPPLRSRMELRAIASEIWPALDNQPGSLWTHDAAALGLYIQTERFFIIN